MMQIILIPTTMMKQSMHIQTQKIPDDENCSDWEFDYEDNIWICNDSSSSYYRNYFFLGTYFATKNMLHKNNEFTQYKSSGIIKRTNSSVKKSGFGSGVSGGIGG
ncbi:hypothetical protein [Bacillus sp. AFS041924]|uniref:hypothetical protein n=1 Tax=Bacillus sp. AFS041924 TaxID=2033503 RepID=UPI000BFBD8D1|nr:hypothetical protein [Bacillus sp. AFS041924]PGS56470.1 hypothetical protein COC46_00710 [Bacillus sp. AFS041924]